jgi:sigma-B regulation protein RsbU (phosphoserine phosphatase)
MWLHGDFNIFAVSSLINFLLSVVIGLFVFLKNTRSKVNSAFFYMSLCVANWALFWFLCFSEYIEKSALLYTRIAILSALFIPPFYLHFSLFLIKKDTEKKKIMLISYLVSIFVFFLAVIYPGQFVGAVKKPVFNATFYPSSPGFLYYIFTSFFSLEAGYAIYQMIKSYPQSSGIKKNQIRYAIFSSIVGFTCGGSTFITVYGVPFPPYLNLFMWLYAAILGYAIVKYRLFEIETLIHRTILWILASSSVFLPVILFMLFARPFLSKMDILSLSLVVTLLYFIVKYYQSKTQPKIDHIFRRKKYDYSQMLGMLSLSLRGILEVDEISHQVSNSLKEALYIQKIAVVIKNKKEEFIPLIEEGFVKDLPHLSAQDKLIGYLKSNTYLEPELIEVDPRLFYVKDSPFYKFLKEEDIPLILPIKAEKDFIGLIILGKKQGIQSYALKDIGILKNISSDISLYFYNALHHEDVVEKERLAEELKLGREIQQNLLPRAIPTVEGLILRGLMLPAKEIGGDYYDFMVGVKDTGSKYLGIAIGDVSGKGVAAGLIMATAKATLKGLIQQGLTSKEILRQANNILYEYTNGEKFMTLIFMQWDSQVKALNYSSAGHEHILLYHKQGSATAGVIEAIPSGGFMLGVIPDIAQFLDNRELFIKAGDKVILYTDGVTEARNPNEELFSLERLIDIIGKHGHKSADELLNSIKEEVYSFIGTREQYDDITLVVMEAT